MFTSVLIFSQSSQSALMKLDMLSENIGLMKPQAFLHDYPHLHNFVIQSLILYCIQTFMN